jgi:hypothetical protein
VVTEEPIEAVKDRAYQKEAIVAGWGFPIAGRTERPHYHDARIVYRAFWIDRDP